MAEFLVGFGGDCLNPNWADAGRVHDWRNYANDDLRAVWPTFTPVQKRIVAQQLDEIAGNEHWD